MKMHLKLKFDAILKTSRSSWWKVARSFFSRLFFFSTILWKLNFSYLIELTLISTYHLFKEIRVNSNVVFHKKIYKYKNKENQLIIIWILQKLPIKISHRIDAFSDEFESHEKFKNFRLEQQVKTIKVK